MKVRMRLLAALVLGGRFIISGTAFASEQTDSEQMTTERVSPDQTNEETSALGRLALALSAGNDAIVSLRGSENGVDGKDRLELSIADMECDVNRIITYVSCYSSAFSTREEAGDLFTRFVDEFKSILPPTRWRKVKEQPGINSVDSWSYEDQRSNARIDIDLTVLVGSYRVTIFGWTATYPSL